MGPKPKPAECTADAIDKANNKAKLGEAKEEEIPEHDPSKKSVDEESKVSDSNGKVGTSV